MKFGKVVRHDTKKKGCEGPFEGGGGVLALFFFFTLVGDFR